MFVIFFVRSFTENWNFFVRLNNHLVLVYGSQFDSREKTVFGNHYANVLSVVNVILQIP